jgi:hypothetical protein
MKNRSDSVKVGKERVDIGASCDEQTALESLYEETGTVQWDLLIRPRSRARPRMSADAFLCGQHFYSSSSS